LRHFYTKNQQYCHKEIKSATTGYKVLAPGHLSETGKREDASMCSASAHSIVFNTEGINHENLA